MNFGTEDHPSGREGIPIVCTRAVQYIHRFAQETQGGTQEWP